jgi:hypothetical protein
MFEETDPVLNTESVPLKTFLTNPSRLKAMSHGAIFLATCNAILFLRDIN